MTSVDEVTGALLLSKPAIAELARVQRPVVTMWVKRYRRSPHPFPAPVIVTDSVERYRAVEVVEWLRARGLGNSDSLAEDLALHAALGHECGLAPAVIVDGLTALLCVKVQLGVQLSELSTGDLLDEVDELDPDDEYLLREVEALGDEVALLAGLADRMSDAAYTPAQAFEALMGRRFRLGLRDLAGSALRPALLDLVSRIAVAVTPDDGAVFVDPSVDGSDLLVALRGALPEYVEPVAVTGRADTAVARLTRRRLAVHEWRVRAVSADPAGTSGGASGSVAPVADLGVVGAATFVTQFPAPGAPEASELEVLTAIDEIALQMRPGQVAVLVAPASVLVDPLGDREAESVRSTLLRADRVRAALRLPEGLLVSRPGLSMAVWVLGDADGSVSPADRWTVLADLGGVELDSSVTDGVVHDVLAAMGAREFRRAHAFRFGSVYRTAALLAQRSLRLPRPRPALQPRLAAGAVAGLVVAQVAAVNDDAARLDSWLSVPVEYHAEALPAPTESAGSLADARELSLVPGNRIDDGHVRESDVENAAGVVPVIGADEILGRRAVGSRGVDRLDFTTSYPSGRYTEPGDIVFCTSPRFGVTVDAVGSSVVLFPARVLRVADPAASGLVPELIARHLASVGVGERTPGAVRGGKPWRAWQIPRIDAARVPAVAAALAELRRRRQAAADLLSSIDVLTGTLVDGVGRGVLTVTDDTRTDSEKG